ncbi:MAG: hypothetical protein KGZ84_04965 [Erysipelotrichia bacterium]|nr:hypothetical protein [Erysipelotrichia bacterium]
MMLNNMQRIDEYLKSDENSKRCEPFDQLKIKYVALHKLYANSFHELNKDLESKVIKREYAKGGEVLHRGFYSPSTLDLIVGNYNRGKLLKRISNNTKYNYEYLFDAQNSLICVYSYYIVEDVFKLISTELFVRNQNKVLSLVFSTDDYSLSFISECQFENGKLISYETALCELLDSEVYCSEINVETYEYVDDLMKSMCWTRYSPSIKLLTQERYIFSRDTDGFLSTYKVEHIEGFMPKMKELQSRQIYNVRVKRR